MKDLFLIISSIVTVCSVIPYIRDILRGKTKPNITSWITWTLLTGIATIAEFSAHEYRTAIFTTAVSLEQLAIIILGLKYGYVKYSRFDIACQIGALSGLFLWWLFNSPLVAVISSVTIDFIGAMPTLRHSWKNPFEETWSLFVVSALGGLFAIFAMTDYNATSLAYPIWIVVISAAIALTIVSRRKSIKL